MKAPPTFSTGDPSVLRGGFDPGQFEAGVSHGGEHVRGLTRGAAWLASAKYSPSRYRFTSCVGGLSAARWLVAPAFRPAHLADVSGIGLNEGLRYRRAGRGAERRAT